MEEIIIQGKPYSGSKIATKGLNPTLVDRIFKMFFDSMGGTRLDKALIVDTMYWDSMWYTIYTYSRYTNITDKSDDNKAGRQSYFSLSLVIPQAFLYLTSEVYKLLDKVYTDVIEGTYISKEGKYLVQDFTNQANFSKVVEKIKVEFAGSNLQDPIDSSFRKEHSTQEIRYNVLDCDSRAFLEDLKLNGRIIVGAGDDFPKKCAASVIMVKEAQIQQLSAKLKEQERKINALNTDLSNAQQAANKSESSVKNQLKQLEEKVGALEKKNEQINQQLIDKQSELDDLVVKIRALLPNSQTAKPTPDDKPIVGDNGLKKYFRFFPLANFVLIVVCIFLLILKSGSPKPPDAAIKELTNQVEQLEEDNKTKDRELKQLQATCQHQQQTIARLSNHDDNTSYSVLGGSQTTSTVQQEKDLDCGIRITKINGAELGKKSTIKMGETITITWNPMANYSWHSSIDDASELNNSRIAGEATITMWVRGEVILWYRTEDRKNGNDNNKIKLKVE